MRTRPMFGKFPGTDNQTLNFPETVWYWDHSRHLLPSFFIFRFASLAAVWQSVNLWKSGIKHSLWNSNSKRFGVAAFIVRTTRVPTFCRLHIATLVGGLGWCPTSELAHCVCVCARTCVCVRERVCVNLTCWWWGVPASTVSHLLDKSLICVTQQQQGIMGVLGRRLEI